MKATERFFSRRTVYDKNFLTFCVCRFSSVSKGTTWSVVLYSITAAAACREQHWREASQAFYRVSMVYSNMQATACAGITYQLTTFPDLSLYFPRASPSFLTLSRSFITLFPQFHHTSPEFTAILPRFYRTFIAFLPSLPQFSRSFIAPLSHFSLVYRNSPAVLPHLYRIFITFHRTFTQFSAHFPRASLTLSSFPLFPPFPARQYSLLLLYFRVQVSEVVSFSIKTKVVKENKDQFYHN